MEQNTLTPSASEAVSAPQGRSFLADPDKRKYTLLPAPDKAMALVRWLEDNKARDVVVLDVSQHSPCMDVIVVLTATSLRHAKSLADGLMAECTKHQYEFFRMEGYHSAQWILADLNDVVVHIFQPDTRELFRLESLWKDAAVLHGEVHRPVRDAVEETALF